MQYPHNLNLNKSEGREEAPKKSSRTPSRRRAVIKGSAAIVGGVAAATYVTPTIRRLGVPAALAISGGTPPPPTATPPSNVDLGCTPGFWGNAPWGVDLWNAANDIDWKHAGGASPYNPFVTT